MSDPDISALPRQLTVSAWQRLSSALFVIIPLLACLSLAQSVRATPDMSQYELAFGDEFNGSELDSSKWNTGLLWGPYQPINNEEQLYVDTLGMHKNFDFSPFEFTGTSLKIVATPTSAVQLPPDRPAENDAVWDSFPEYRYNGPTTSGPGYQPSDVGYLSGIITSYDTFRFTHGYVETRMKLPAGKGLWPAFWALTSFYVEDVPEIDVMEFLGDQTDRVYHTYHYFQPQNNWTQVSTPSFTTLAENFTDDWHVFGMQWGPTEIIWYVDGVETRRIDTSEYDIANQAMYLLANLAVGGSWPGAPDAQTVFPAELEIDYIRAYQRKPVGTITPAILADEFQLVFEDTFSGSAVNSDKWNSSFIWGPYLSINNEEQIYPDMLGEHQNYDVNPFSVSDGVLSITATAVTESLLPERQEANSVQFTNNPNWAKDSGYRGDPRSPDYYVPGYVSGLLTTYDSFKFVNGYAETRARLPTGSGLWPAFWLLNGYYVGQQPEIDIMEFRGEKPDEIVHSYHYFNSEGLQSESYTTSGTDYSADFHTYGVHWQPGRIDWYVDGQLVHSTSGENISSQVMYLILNLAVGGNFVDDVDRDALPASYEVDYVRVWQRTIADDAKPPNVAPIATDDSAGPIEAGTTLSINVLDNDSDSDGSIDTDTLVITLQPTEGTASVTANGQIEYTHPGGGTTSGSDTVRYTVRDDDGTISNEAVVTIAIIAPRETNTPPLAMGDTAGPVYIGGSITFSVLTNDSDSDGELVPATLTIVDEPLTGIALVKPNGQISYTHDGTPGTMQDVLSYTVQDDDGAVSNAATMRIKPFNESALTRCPAVMPLGNTGKGIAARDNATGTGWLMWSSQNVTTRFSPRPFSGNAAHLIAVQFVSGTWHVDNNSVLTPFTPAGDDCLVAELDFDADTATLLLGGDQVVNGIDSGFNSGDMSITPNQWNEVFNRGEFGIGGTSIGKAQGGANTPPIAANDIASPVDVGQSLTINVLANDSDNDGTLDAASVVITTQPAEGIATAQPNGQIEYVHSGGATSGSDAFAYTVSDNDGDSSNAATVTLAINNTAGSTQCPAVMPLGNTGKGIAARDNATGTGWLMWSSQNVTTRFSPRPFSGNAAHLIAVQFVSGTWHVDNNSVLTPFTPAGDDCLVAELDFDADTATLLLGGDQVVNGIDSGFNSGDMSITPNQWNEVFNRGEFGISGTSIGKAQGGANTPPIAANDIASPVDVGQSLTINVLANDSDNDGTLDAASVVITTQPAEGIATAQPNGQIEYVHSGGATSGSDAFAYTVSDNDGDSSNAATVTLAINNTAGSTQCPAVMPLGNTGKGIAARDNATGTGWLMWSSQNVTTRFSPRPFSGNAAHLIAVQFVSGTWHVDNNSVLTPFTPAGDDCLVAELDFDADTATLLLGGDQVVNGIDSGFNSGDMSITPNQWYGRFNRGEFGIGGTSIQ